MKEELSEQAKAQFFDELIGYYVDQQGLGAMPKADLDALVVHLYLKYGAVREIDAFELSSKFKVKKGRIKSLIETGWIKFGTADQEQVWLEILNCLSRVSVELESLEKGQIRFKLENPAHFRYIQREIRQVESTASYSAAAEQVIAQFDAFNRMVDRVYEKVLENKREDAVEPIKAIYRRIRTDIIGPERFEEYRSGEKAETRLGKNLRQASQLAGIGAFVIDGFGGGGAAGAAAGVAGT